MRPEQGLSTHAPCLTKEVTVPTANERIILPLDFPTLQEALHMAVLLKDDVGAFKIGLELFTAEGDKAIREVMDRTGKRVFYDSKLLDIPNTVRGAAEAATRMGVWMFNVHTLGGRAMMDAAAEGARTISEKLGIEKPLVIGVTILTSISQEVMNSELRIPGPVSDEVAHLARMAEDAGLDGVVASPHEIEAVRRSCGKQMLVVTPGVRPSWAEANDQKRIMTPGEAIRKGADYLVIGRAITGAPDPVIALRRIVEEIDAALHPV